MLFPSAAPSAILATPDVESAYRAYHGLEPRQTVDNQSDRTLSRSPLPEDESERGPDESPPSDRTLLEDPRPEHIRDDESAQWPDSTLLENPWPEHIRDDDSERWPDEWPPDEEPPRTIRSDTPPPPPYTALVSTSPTQVRKKLVKPQRQMCLARLKTSMAAFGQQVKTRWVPAIQQEFIIFLGYLAGYDGNGKPLPSLGRPRKALKTGGAS